MASHVCSHCKRAGMAAIVVVALFAFWLGFRLGGRGATRDFDDLLTALSAIGACFLCWRAREAHEGLIRRFWSLMAAATASWGAAEVIWGIYDALLHRLPPSPSWADVGYLAAIPIVVVALLQHPAMHARHRREGRLVARTVLDGLIVATAILFLSWSFVLGPLWRHTDLSTLGGLVTVAYPFSDIVMLFLVVLVTTASEPGDRFALWCVLVGLTAMALSDSTYCYLLETGRYYSGNLVDVGWVVAYLGLAMGAFASTHSAPGQVVKQRDDRLLSVVVSFVPILCALIASALEVLLGRRLMWSDWVMALTLAVLVVVRQALLLTGRLAGDEASRSPHDWDRRRAMPLTVPSEAATPAHEERAER